jgi:hypothetical protein
LEKFLKRPSVWGSIVAVVVIAITAFAFFYPDASQGNVLQQYDIQQGAANGHELEQYRADHNGETSWWTNSLFGGMPAFQISPSYPSTSLFGWINDAYGLWLPAPSNLLVMMMLGMFVLLMVMNVRWYLALIGAIAWGFSSYFVIIIGAGHIWKFITLSYVPLTVAGVVLTYRGKRLIGTALTAVAMMMQISNNHVQMSYYFALVTAAFVIAYAVEAYRNKAWRQWGIHTGLVAAAMVLAVAANLPNLYHTYEYSKETIRGQHSELTNPNADSANTTSGLDRDYITAYSYGRTETLSLLIPNIQGGASAKPVHGQMTALPLSQTDQGKELRKRGGAMELLDYLSQYFGGAEGTNGPVYVGAVIVALFLLGAVIVRGPIKWALVILTVLSIGLAWGRNMQWLTDLFINFMPMYAKFRTVESILVIAEFTMPLLAILGLQKMLTTPDAWTAYRKPLLGSFGVCLLLCIIGIVAPGIYGSVIMGEYDRAMFGDYAAQYVQEYPEVFAAAEQLRHSLLSADALRSFLFLGVAGVALAMAARRKLPRDAAVVVVGACVLIDLYGVDKRYLNHDSFVAAPRQSTAAPFTPSHADQCILADKDPNFRVLDAYNFMSAAPSYFHKSIGGYHAAKLTRYQDLIDRHLIPVLQGDTAVNHEQVLNMLNTKYIIINGESDPILNPDALGNAWFVSGLRYVNSADEEMEALGTLDPATEAVADARFRTALGDEKVTSPAPGDFIKLTEYEPNKLTYKVRSAAGGLAVLSEIYFPWGWKATLDGSDTELPIGRVDYVLRAVKLPKGDHTLTLTFNPASVRTTNAIATTAVLLVYLLLALAAILAIGKSRKKNVVA